MPLRTKPWAFRVGLLGVLAAVAGLLWWLPAGRNSEDIEAEVEIRELLTAPGDSLTARAVKAWAERAQTNPRDLEAWLNLGHALMQRARETQRSVHHRAAELSFHKGLSLDPQNPSAMTGLAWVHGSRHDFESSIEWANKALAQDPNNPEAYGLLGDAALELGDYEAASQHYQKMIDLRPDLASYSRGAQFLYLSGDTRKAIWLMQKAIAAGAPFAENTAWGKAQFALMLFNTGALLPAEQVLEKALKQTPDNYHLLNAMGKVKAARKEFDSAIKFYQRAASMSQQYDALAALVDLYTLIGQEENAEERRVLVEALLKANEASDPSSRIQTARFYADQERNSREALEIAKAVYKKYKNVYVCDTLVSCHRNS